MMEKGPQEDTAKTERVQAIIILIATCKLKSFYLTFYDVIFKSHNKKEANKMSAI